MLPDQVHVVQNDDQRAALRVPRQQHRQQRPRGGAIDRGERFIKQDNRCLLHDGAGEKQALELPGGQRLH